MPRAHLLAAIIATMSRRTSDRGPVAEVLKRLPPELAAIAPRRYERIGDVPLLKMEGVDDDSRRQIAESYARALGARTVAMDRGVLGPWRQPEVEVVWGD